MGGPFACLHVCMACGTTGEALQMPQGHGLAVGKAALD